MTVLSRTVARMPSVPLPGLTWAVRTWLQKSFGEPPLDPDAPRGDLGLFGPGSASWQLFGDAASIVGGIRSLMVQLTGRKRWRLWKKPSQSWEMKGVRAGPCEPASNTVLPPILLDLWLPVRPRHIRGRDEGDVLE